jgi:hypothetical protein
MYCICQIAHPGPPPRPRGRTQFWGLPGATKRAPPMPRALLLLLRRHHLLLLLLLLAQGEVGGKRWATE